MRKSTMVRGYAAVTVAAALIVATAGLSAAETNTVYTATNSVSVNAGDSFTLTQDVANPAPSTTCTLSAQQTSGPVALDLSTIVSGAYVSSTSTAGDYTVDVICTGDEDEVINPSPSPSPTSSDNGQGGNTQGGNTQGGNTQGGNTQGSTPAPSASATSGTQGGNSQGTAPEPTPSASHDEDNSSGDADDYTLITTWTIHVAAPTDPTSVTISDKTFYVSQSGTNGTTQTPVILPDGRGGAVSWSVTSGSAGCTVTPDTGVVSFTNAGTCDLTVTVAANSPYGEVTDTATITVLDNVVIPYTYKVVVLGWVQATRSKANDARLSMARANGVKAFLSGIGLEGGSFAVGGKGVKSASAKARSARVVVVWNGPTSGSAMTTVFFASGSSKLSRGAKAQLRALVARIPSN